MTFISSVEKNKLGKIVLNTDIYKSACICAFMLIPSIIFCYFSKYVSIAFILWGAVILLHDLFTERRFAKPSYSLFLGLFIMGYCITLLLYTKNDIISTFHIFIWVILEFFLLYAFNDSKDVDLIIKDMYKINIPITVVAFICAAASLVIFFMRISIVTPDPEGINSFWSFGLVDGRNSGIFNNPIPYANAMLIGIIASVWNFSSRRLLRPSVSKRIELTDVYYILTGAVCLASMLTSLTRSVLYGFYIMVGCFTFISTYMLLKPNKRLLFGIIVSICAAVIGVGLTFGVCTGIKSVMVKIVSKQIPRAYVIDNKLTNSSGTSSNPSKTSSNSSEKPSDSSKIEVGKLDDGVLKRIGATSEITMERKELSRLPSFFYPRSEMWKVALEVIPHSPIFGFTSGNRNSSSLKYGSGSFIRNLSNGITTYHNAYIDIAVSAGLLGLILILIFIVLSARQTIVCIFSNKFELEKQNNLFYGILASYAATHCGIISMFFGVIVFNNISICLYFWIALGLLNHWNQLLKDNEDKNLSIYSVNREYTKKLMKVSVD